MSDSNSSQTQRWIFAGTCVTAIAMIVVALLPILNNQQESESTSPKFETLILSAKSSSGRTLTVSQGETLKITASGSVNTRQDGGTIEDCDISTGPDGLENCHYTNEKPELHGLAFMGLIGEFNGRRELIGSYKEKV
jgi:hypothetical protein